MATLPGAWHYRVSAGTGRPGVSILWLNEVESLVYSFCLSVAASKIVWADPSLRYTCMLLGRWATNQQQPHPDPPMPPRPVSVSVLSVSVCLSVCLSLCLSVSLSVSLCIFLSVTIFSACLSVWVSVFLLLLLLLPFLHKAHKCKRFKEKVSWLYVVCVCV